MEIRITSRHEKASPSLQETIVAELNKIEKFSEKITSCHVILDAERIHKTAEITMHVFNREVIGAAKAEHIGKAFDSALAKVERQLKKVNEKIKMRKRTKATPPLEG